MATCLTGLLLVAGAAQADDIRNAIRAEILTGWRTQDGHHVAGLRLSLAPGWKTYWRAPGDAGIPPVFNWQGSGNLTALNVIWPTPEVFDQDGMQSIGYSNDVVLPLAVHPHDLSRDVELRGQMTVGICRDICVPTTLEISAALPVAQTRRVAALATAMADQPFSGREAGVTRTECRMRAIEGGMEIQASVTMPSAGGPEVMVLETANPALWVSSVTSHRDGVTLAGKARIYHADGAPFVLSRGDIRVTVLGRDFAVDIRGCAARQ